MYKIIKNLVERLLAIILLLVLILIPIIPLTALLIYLEDKGNIFFKQERIGENGVPFQVLKFRSMYVNADKDLQNDINNGEVSGLDFKDHANSMVTKVGKVIRQTSIDELPQLLNIIKGEMSVVGPRPLQAFEVKEYKEIDPTHAYKMQKRLSVKPGLLCYWQVTKNKNDMPFEERMDLDVAYVDDLSLKTDVIIIFQGIKTVLFSNNM